MVVYCILVAWPVSCVVRSLVVDVTVGVVYTNNPIDVGLLVVCFGAGFVRHSGFDNDGSPAGIRPDATLRKSVLNIEPFVCPSAVIRRVSTHVNDRTMPRSRSSRIHNRCRSMLFSAGGLIRSTDNADHIDIASMATLSCTDMPPFSRRLLPSIADTGPFATSCNIRANNSPESVAAIAACNSDVKVLLVTVFMAEQSQWRRWHTLLP